jgi:type IV pilus assembly protein PilV
LLEVLVAVSLLAVSLLGVAAAQLAAVRDADAQAHRVQASWAAASLAEAMQAPDLAAFVLARSRAHAGAALPGARIAIVDETARVSAVAVGWTLTPSALARPQPPGGACAHAHDNAPTPCVALPFASRQ